MRVAVALGAAALLFAAESHGQRATELETGSRIPIPARARIPDEGRVSTELRGRVVMAEFARCALDRSPKQVASVLRDPIGDDYHKKVVALSTSECLSDGMLRFQPILLRGALFTELWRRRAAAERAGRVWAPVLPEFDDKIPPAENVEARRNYVLLWFAHCIATTERSVASEYVLAAPGKAQNASFEALAPTLGSCWRTGEPLRMNHAVLAGALAEGLYRARPPATATAEVKK